MAVPQFLLESGYYVIDEFLAEHLVLQASEKAVFEVLPLDSQTVSANGIAALRMK